MNPIRVTRESIIKYREMYREIYLLSLKYPEIWLIYERLPKKIWRYSENIYNALYLGILFLLFLINRLFFNFFEFGFEFKTLTYSDGADALYSILMFIQIPFYFLIKGFFRKRIKKIYGLLSDLNDMIKDRMDSKKIISEI
jgi:hypothetical protein